MATKLLCYLVFIILETVIISGSIVVVVCLYLPFVVIKGLVLTLLGKASVRTNAGDSPRPSGVGG